MVYLAQCLFCGDESLRFLAAMMRHARNTRCLVQDMPRAKGGRRARSLARYTRELMRVAVCTLERDTRLLMNDFKEGRF